MEIEQNSFGKKHLGNRKTPTMATSGISFPPTFGVSNNPKNFG
jgi:hypothetical protein